jgi:hypothetical protein
MIWRYVETPFAYALTARFEGEEVTVEQRGANANATSYRLQGRANP